MYKPPGGYIWRGDLTEVFLRDRFGGLIFEGVYTWRGLYMEGLIFGILWYYGQYSKNMISARTKGLAVAGIHNKNQHTIMTMFYFELLFTIWDILHNRFMKSNFSNDADVVKISHTLQMSELTWYIDSTLPITKYSQ